MVRNASYNVIADEGYTYDANGNRTNTGYQTGGNNQLSSDGTYNYTYDNEGNLKTRTELATGKVREFTWDYRNRLTGVTDKTAGTVTQQVSYTYDALNQRLAKTVGTQTTRFVYDRGNVYLEFSGTNTTPSTRYLYGPMVDQVLAQESNNQTTWMLTDHLGSVRDLVNSSGAVVNHFTYDSFGQVVGSTGTVDTRYKFTGREYDNETGLYYYRARYFDAGVGRFVGQDPMGFGAGDSNLYRYVGNKATTYNDPSGKLQIYYMFSDVGKFDLPDGTTLKSGQNHIDLYILTKEYSLTLGFDPDRDKTRNGAITYKVPLRDNFANNPVRSHSQVKQDETFMNQQTQLIYDDPFDDKCESQKNKDLIRTFQTEGLRIHQALIPYEAGTTNSNAAMYTALTKTAQRFSQLKVQEPRYSSPGWGIDVYTFKPRKLIYG